MAAPKKSASSSTHISIKLFVGATIIVPKANLIMSIDENTEEARIRMVGESTSWRVPKEEAERIQEELSL